jgi:hypothetical protein
VAAPTFGATVALLEGDFFGGKGIQGIPRLVTMATAVLEEIAGDVARALRTARVEPGTINLGSSPDSYDWCQKTILYGAAPEFSRRASRDEVPLADGWDAKYRARLQELASSPSSVLGDAVAFRTQGGVRQVFT